MHIIIKFLLIIYMTQFYMCFCSRGQPLRIISTHTRARLNMCPCFFRILNTYHAQLQILVKKYYYTTLLNYNDDLLTKSIEVVLTGLYFCLYFEIFLSLGKQNKFQYRPRYYNIIRKRICTLNSQYVIIFTNNFFLLGFLQKII